MRPFLWVVVTPIGYYSKIIDTAFNKARLIPRSEALKKVPKKKNEREVFVCTFNPALPSIKTIVKKTLVCDD